MVGNSAFGINTTASRTWVLALLVDAGKVAGTFRVDGTLRSTVRGCADVVRLAGACRGIPSSYAVGVRTTW